MSKQRSLTILAVSDLHYTGLSLPTKSAACSCEVHGRTLLRKVFQRLAYMGVKPDMTLLLGDVLADGSEPGAHLDRLAIYSELVQSKIPFIALPGNHDGDQDSFYEVFPRHEDLTMLNGYGLMVFDDRYSELHNCVRSDEDIVRTKKAGRTHRNTPLIAVQHPPIYPPIDSYYPYRPINCADIIDSFHKGGVILSVSGHYHKGLKPRTHEGVCYHTVPALCDSPYSFSLIYVKGENVEVEEHSLAMQVPNLVDCHSHTEFAYCATTADAAASISLSQALGVSQLCITEHSFQLYFDRRYAMGFQWKSEPREVERVWETRERGRMSAFAQFAEKLRSPFVRVGLEVDLYDNGKLLLAPQDEELNWDILIGGIHGVQGFVRGRTTQKEAEQLFMRDVEQLLSHNIDVLSHPFRFFARAGLELPTHLFKEVAGLLSECGVAAEINFHTNRPNLEFIRMCREFGVRIALASDMHDLVEAGEFWPHVQLLREAGITPRLYPEALFRPRPDMATRHITDQ